MTVVVPYWAVSWPGSVPPFSDACFGRHGGIAIPEHDKEKFPPVCPLLCGGVQEVCGEKMYCKLYFFFCEKIHQFTLHNGQLNLMKSLQDIAIKFMIKSEQCNVLRSAHQHYSDPA